MMQLRIAAAAAGLGLVAAAAGAGGPITTPGSPSGQACPASCESGEVETRAAARRLIRAQTFWSLPKSHRDAIAGKLIERGEPIPGLRPRGDGLNEKLDGRDAALAGAELDAAWEKVRPMVDIERGTFEGFRPVHQRMLARMSELVQERPMQMSPCFAPGTDPKLVEAVSDLISFGRAFGDEPDIAFEDTDRWGPTALDPGGGGQGNPTTLTYSFPPDGTFLPDQGFGSGSNSLNSFLDGIYGDRATWRDIYDGIFDRWGELCGIEYVLEPNDDGVTMFENEGASGVRGDLRMAGQPIDGNGGVLAFNFFPQVGDMVIDTADSFYNDTSDDSLRLRNILAHEHGHGMGQLHVCPVQQLKLMEPFVTTAFDGPQFDDILNAQRNYGDPFEPNDDPGAATALGSLSDGQSLTVNTVSLDDDTDDDYYAFTLNGSAEVSLTMTPQTEDYQAGPQTSSCDEPAPYDPIDFLNPEIALLSEDGNSVIESSDANPAGQAESIVRTLESGTYLVRLSGDQPIGDQIIAYELDVGASFPGLDISVDGGLPTQIDPGESVTVNATIVENQDAIVSPPQLNYQPEGDSQFSSVEFTNTSGDEYTATLPAFLCDEDPELFISVEAQMEGTVTFPEEGTVTAAVVSGTDVLVDNAETNIGWTVSGDAFEGQWERGVPQDNGRDDPPSDFDGSGQAWLTGPDPNDENSDVDGGATILTSPAFDYSGGGSISFAYWAQDSLNPIGPEDGFFLEYSTDGGGSWTQIRDYSTAGEWRQDTVDVDAEIGQPSNLRIRFIAQDEDPGNVLECGLDAIEFARATCEDPDCPADLTGPDGEPDGMLTSADFLAYIDLFAAGDPDADFNGDGEVTSGDFLAYIDAFAQGCP